MNVKTCLMFDEVVVENPGISSPEELLGKVPFVLDNEVFPWSKLDCHGVKLMVCANPESQDLVLIQNLEDEKIESLKKSKPEQGPVHTLAMIRNFRSSNAIHHFLKELEIQCSKEHKEFGYMIPPDAVRQGHEIHGQTPTWIEARTHRHMKCQQPNCSNCFLVPIKEKFDKVVENVRSEGIPNEDILVILSASAYTRNVRCSLETKFLKSTYPELNIKSNFAFDGMEAKVVIVIRNGGILSFSLSNAISRAVTKLILFCPDEDKILERCCKKGLLVKMSDETSGNSSEGYSMPSSPDDTLNHPLLQHPFCESLINSSSDERKPEVKMHLLNAIKASEGTLGKDNNPISGFENFQPPKGKLVLVICTYKI